MSPATSSDPHADPQAGLHRTAALFRSLAPAVDFCSLRIVDERSDYLGVRQDVLQPPSTSQSQGAMVSVVHQGGYGYAATSDLSAAGLREAITRALDWAARSAGTRSSTSPASNCRVRRAATRAPASRHQCNARAARSSIC